MRGLKIGAVALLLAVMASPVMAQTPPPPLPPELQAAYANVPPATIARIQEDLVFAAGFTGAVDGIMSVRTYDAIRAFQQRLNRPQTGILSNEERPILQRMADERRTALGWRVVDDRATASRIGIPTRLVGAPRAQGQRTFYAAADGSLRIEVFQVPETGVDLQQLYDRERAPTDTRKPSYQIIRPDFFAIGGTDGTRRFDMRVVVRDGIAKGFLASYEPRLQVQMSPILIAMAGSFLPFGAAAPAPGPGPAPGPAPGANNPIDRPLAAMPAPVSNLLYGTAVVVSPTGDLLTSARLVEKCDVVAVGKLGYAAVINRQADLDIAHLRVYGRTDLAAFGLAAGPPRAGETVAIAARPHPARRPEGLDTANGRIEDTRPNGRALVATPFNNGNHGGAVVTPDLKLSALMVGPPGGLIQVVGGPPPPAVVIGIGADRLAALLARGGATSRPAGPLFVNGPAGADSAAMFRALDTVVVPVACMLKK